MTRCPRCQRRLPANGACAVHGHPTGIVDVVEPMPEPRVIAPRGWILGRRLASGGTAVVYEVQTDAGAPAVMKWGRWRERDIHARFSVEADVLRAVGPPATPAYYEHGVVDMAPYLIMERVPGETLAAWMARAGERGSLGEMLAILVRLAQALSALHAAGYVHRDLKPENVLIGPAGVRLLDFGLAQESTAQPAQIGSVVGTVHYLAPEQLRAGAPVDHRADLYSFGVVAFEMICGRPPFTGARRAIEYNHLVVRPPSVRETRPVPPALDELVLACLAKEPELRPPSAEAVAQRASKVVEEIATLRGVGAPSPRPIGSAGDVAFVWIDGGDPVEVVRALSEVQGIVVRRRGDGILAAFAALHHDAPLAVALSAARTLAIGPCRAVVHLAQALVRRSAAGKPAVYGDAIDQCERWIPAAPFAGLLLSTAAAERAGIATRPSAVTGFFREVVRDRTDATDARAVPPLVGRGDLVQELAAAAVDARGVRVALTGAAGAGKSRILDAVAGVVRASGRTVIAMRGRRRFPGEPPDDARFVEALGGGADLVDALRRAGARGAVLALDDAAWLSPRLGEILARPDVRVGCVAASEELLPGFGAYAGFGDAADDARTLHFAIPPLPYPDADALLRDLLRPARLLPDVLVERLAIRATGNPGTLVALARDIVRRGAVRRHVGTSEWYVAADELDTLLAPPDAAWFATRAIEDLPAELAPVARACAGLGPHFLADEVAAAAGLEDASARLAWLARDGLLREHAGGFEFAEPPIQDALYDHVLDEKALVHARALRFWLAHRADGSQTPRWLARVAFHAGAVGDAATAATCWLALADLARRRGDLAEAAALSARTLACLAAAAPPVVASATKNLG